MLGCIQPMSSPMMNSMLGLDWSCAWTIAVLPSSAALTIVAAARQVAVAVFMSVTLLCKADLGRYGSVCFQWGVSVGRDRRPERACASSVFAAPFRGYRQPTLLVRAWACCRAPTPVALALP